MLPTNKRLKVGSSQSVFGAWDTTRSSPDLFRIIWRFVIGRAAEHSQGIAQDDHGFFLTTTEPREGGCRDQILYYSDGCAAASAREVVEEGFRHPGGIQTIGAYVAVPLWESGESTRGKVALYGRDCKPRFDLIRSTDHRPNAAGITDTGSRKRLRYVLATVVDEKGEKIRFYRTQPGLTKLQRDCFDEHVEWVLPNDWDSSETYPNSISLFSDDKGNVYFLGMRTRGRTQALAAGPDVGNVYQVCWSEDGRHVTLERRYHIHFKLDGQSYSGPSPRWGASLRVVGGTSVQIVFCGYESAGAQHVIVTSSRLYTGGTEHAYGEEVPYGHPRGQRGRIEDCNHQFMKRLQHARAANLLPAR